MKVILPNDCQLTNAYVDLEYQLTYDNTCGSPPEFAPYCTFSQVSMDVLCDSCGTTTGPLQCNAASPPFTGTCTTDSNLVPGAGPILINSFVPNYLACFAPRCVDDTISFTLKDRDSICGDVCGYLCARGNMWQMTVEANAIDASIAQDKSHVCPGDSVTFTAHTLYGVPPYHYVWYNNTGAVTVEDTIYGSNTYTVYPQQNGLVTCIAYDACNFYFLQTNVLGDTVLGSYVNAGPDINLCKGGMATLGGSPTSDGNSVLWNGSDSPAQNWLSDTAAFNPQIHVPTGTLGTFFYIVTAANSNKCVATDTVYVFSTDRATTCNFCIRRYIDFFYGE